MPSLAHFLHIVVYLFIIVWLVSYVYAMYWESVEKNEQWINLFIAGRSANEKIVRGCFVWWRRKLNCNEEIF